MRTADNRVNTVLQLYGNSLGDRYSEGEVKVMVRQVFHAALGWDAAQLALHRDQTLSESELLKVYEPLKRLAAGEPLQYVLGRVQFHGMDLHVGAGVLIPRPETEELVERIIRSGASPRTVVDVGTGSGCIALALKRAFPEAHVVAIDVSAEALRIARGNAEALGLAISWVQADVLAAGFEPPACDLLVSNPPYVTRSEADTLAPEVRDHEPHLALFVPDEDPLLFYRVLAHHALQRLVPGGALWFEGHRDHVHDVGRLLSGMDFTRVEVLLDMSGAPRFIHAQR
jgi:release factor glutamine methyltransferase